MLGNSSLGASCGDLADFGHCADSSLALRPKSTKNSTTSTANTRIFDLDSANQTQSAESRADSADSQNLTKKPCHSEIKDSPSLAEGARGWVKPISSLLDSARHAQNRGNPY